MNKVLIIDHFSEDLMTYTRTIRGLNIYVEATPSTSTFEVSTDLKAIILSGDALFNESSKNLVEVLVNSKLPILTLNEGTKLLSKHLNGEILETNQQEVLIGTYQEGVFKQSSLSHDEVLNTIKDFLLIDLKVTPDWDMKKFIETKVKEIKETVKDDHVILGLSGGVDSTVTAALLSKAIGKQLICIFVDTGLLRKNEAIEVLKNYGVFKDLKIVKVDARNEFYQALKGVTDPEEKRKVIGRVFIEVFEKEKSNHNYAKYLAQGTIYPDVIESFNHTGGLSVKSHHNVGGLPENNTFKILEPLRELFKDEVRKVGYELNLDEQLINRHPFPGPGLGVRVVGEISKERVEILQEADDIFISLLRKHHLYQTVQQAFCVLLPVKSVGVRDGKRTYENVLAIRSINTKDFMTAKFSRLSYDFLEEVSETIIREVKGVNRVVFDITNKPLGTIEWE